MKPSTAIFVSVALCMVALSFGGWTKKQTPKVDGKAQAASGCTETPMSGQARNGSAEDQQRAILKTVECAYGALGPLGGAIMKQQGVDPQDVIRQARQLDSEARR